MSEEGYDPLARANEAKAIEEAQAEAKKHAEKLRSAFKALLGGDSPEQRAVVEYMKGFGHYNETNWQPGVDVLELVHREGKRAFLLQVLAMSGLLEEGQEGSDVLVES